MTRSHPSGTAARLPRRLQRPAAIPVLLFVLMSAGLLIPAGCGTTRAPAVGTTTLSQEQLERADRLLVELRQENALHRDRKALELAYELLDHYRGYPRNDEALLLAVHSARRLGDSRTGRRMVGEFRERFPRSGLAPDVLALGASMAAAEGDTIAAADLALAAHDDTPAGTAREEAAERAGIYLERLPASALGDLMARYPASELRPYLGYLRVQRLLGDGQPAEAQEVVENLRRTAPASEWLTAAEQLYAEPGTRPTLPGAKLPTGPVTTTRVGVLCPLTGRYAVLGNAFYDGALLALQKVNSMGRRQYELVVEDTGGDPVGGVIAARKLIGDAGVIALVGSLLSSTTAAAAVVSDLHGVPLVSPTATNERIWEIGSHVFQTNLTRVFEARVLARLSTRILLKSRFAVLYPDTRAGARNYQLFAEEVRKSGGEVVGAAAFAPEDTDYKAPLQEIRRLRPEVVYIDASVDQMVLLGPQLDYYRVGALIMGPSSWDSAKLLRDTGAIMERALFPSETALFPPSWTRDFEAAWHPEHLPDEATPLALKAYQATRLVLDTLTRDDIERRADLTTALRTRLEDTEFEAHGPEAYAGLVHMFAGEEIVPFPADRFIATWTEPELPPPPPEGAAPELTPPVGTDETMPGSVDEIPPDGVDDVGGTDQDEELR
jgi:ABC-type branched-subunit amino acid transport system substrate-binding protein